jgi:hypothetical protein
MTISTRDQLIDALGNNSSRIVVDKATIANTPTGTPVSLWRATGQPAQAAIPGTTPAVPNDTTTGAIAFTQQTAPATSYLSWLTLMSGSSATTIEVHDRIAHMGGLVLNVTSAQTITGLDIAPGGLNPAAARLGSADYSDVQWFLEFYADGGGTASNATINVTYGDNTSGNLNVATVGGTQRAGRLIPLTPLIPVGDQGKRIRAINSVTLSASTTVAGNFGFTCTRQRTLIQLPLANKAEVADWAMLGLPAVPNGSCLQFFCITSTTGTGTLRGQGKISHG